MAATALDNTTPVQDANLPGSPVIADEDLPKVEEKKEKKDKKEKRDKKDKKDKKEKKDKKDKKAKDKKEKGSDGEESASSETSEKKTKEPKAIRQAVGVIVIDPATQNVLLLGSRKKEGTFVLPRDDCQTDPEEHPEKAALRLLHDKAGVTATFLSNRVGSYSESNKKGKIIAQHWMYEVNAPTLLESWPESERQRVWVSYEDALKATEGKRMSQLALEKCSLAKN